MYNKQKPKKPKKIFFNYYPLFIRMNTRNQYKRQKLVTETDNNLDELISKYEESCKNLPTQPNIDMSDYGKHMILLFNILLEIYKITNGIKHNASISFNIFDEYGISLYKELDSNFDINVSYSLEESRKKIFDKKYGVYSDDNVQLNTVLKNIMYINFKNNTVGLNSDIFQTTKFLEKQDLIFQEYCRKTFCIIPKYHCLDKTNLQDNQFILGILSRLNQFTQHFDKEYFVFDSNQNYPIEVSSLRDLDDQSKNTILYTLINNNYNDIKLVIPYYYYYYHIYPGPQPAMSIINVGDYLQRHKYQPLSISDRILNNISLHYRAFPPLNSRDLNTSLQDFIAYKSEINFDIKQRLKQIMSYLNLQSKENYAETDIYVFHGTDTMMHAENDKELYLSSFLSCTLNIYVSIDYAIHNLDRKSYLDGDLRERHGIIYIFKIDKNIKYINFNDSLYQILMLPGTKIHINSILNISNIKYIICTAENNEDENYGMNLYNSLFTTNASFDTEYKIKHERDQFPACKYTNIEDLGIDEEYKSISFTNTLIIWPNYLKTDVYESYKKMTVMMNLHIMNNAYIYFVNMPKYIILYDEQSNSMRTAFETDDNYIYKLRPDQYKYNVRNIFVDTLFLFYDCLSPNMYRLNKSTGEVQTAFIFNIGMFDINDNKKVKFSLKSYPSEHIAIAHKLSDELKKSLIDDLDSIINDFREKNDNFHEYLEVMKNQYMDFIKNDLNLSHESIAYKYLKNDVTYIFDVLLYRSNFFKSNMDNIKESIIKYMSQQHQAGGKIQDAYVLPSPSMSVKGSVKGSVKRSPSMFMKSVTRSLSMSVQSPTKHIQFNKYYQAIINIPLPSNTVYKITDLKEPYKSYYKTVAENNKYVNISTNRGYMIPKKEWKRIHKYSAIN